MRAPPPLLHTIGCRVTAAWRPLGTILACGRGRWSPCVRCLLTTAAAAVPYRLCRRCTAAASGLDVRYMKILKEEKNYAPSRWFRVVAMANSYQIRPN